MLSELLKEKTLNAHQRLEKKIILLLKQIEDKQDYAWILQQFYSFYKPLEALISSFIDQSVLADYAQRRKSDALLQDIKTLEADIPVSFAQKHNLPQINNHLTAMGALYVLEGSTLGGRIISGMVYKKLNLNTGFNFFNSYGEQTPVMWQKFLMALNQKQLDKNESLLVVDTAEETFNNLFIHIKKNGRKEKL